MARLTPAEQREKWAQRTAAATQDYAEGVRRVTSAPGAKAAAKVAKWRAGLQASEQKFVRNVSRVGLAEWQEAAINVGASRIAQGVQEKGGKYEQFVAEFQPFQDRIVASAAQMDDTTLEGRIAKATYVMRETAKFRRSGV